MMSAHRLISRSLCIVLVFIMLIPVIVPVYAQGGISETFDDSDLPGWELSPGVTVADGVLRMPGGSGAAFNGNIPGDFTLSVRAQFASGQGEIMLLYRATESSAYHTVIGPEYAMLAYTDWEPLGGTGFAWLEGWFEIGITAQGEQHTVSINRQPVLSVVDAQQLSGGGIGFQVMGEDVVVEFDDFQLTTSSAVTPPVDTGADQPPTDGITGTPAYEAPAWVNLGGPPGGLGYDIRMRPDNPDEMYVTDARAGIFKSVDGGLTWFATNGNLVFGPDAVAPIFCATIDPHNYDVVWIGTQITGHLYRSADAGQSWETRDNGIIHEGRSLRGITIDPNSANVVYVGLEVEAGMWQREHPEAEANMVGGEVYKSTDGGLNWVRIWKGPNVARYVWIDPRNSNRVYVSTGIFDRIPANSNHAADDPGGVGILRSDDAGQTWTVLDERNGLGGRIIPSLFMHPTNPDILIAAVFGSNIQNGVYVTRNGGDTWEQSLNYPMGMHNVEIATSNPDIWYAATENAAFRSDDAGLTWIDYILATPDRDAGMPIDLQVDPRDPYRIFVNNYGGSNFVSTDGGVSWVDASKGYTGASVDVFTLPDSTVMAAANTGIFHSIDSGLTWPGLNYADEMAPATDSSNHLLFAARGNVLHSTNGGESWYAVNVVNLTAEEQAGRIAVDVLTSRLAVAPSDPQTVYLGFLDSLCHTGGIEACFRAIPGFFRSHDEGYTWEKVSSGPFENVATLRIAVHPQDSRKLFVATGDGLYVSRDGGDSWEQVTTLTNAAAQVTIWDTDSELSQSNAVIITDVVFDPYNPNILYAAALQKGVFRSDDGGVTWQTAAYGMDPNEPVLALIPDPNRPGVIYAGSRWSGVFVSIDGTQTWRQISNGLDNPSVISLALSPDGSILYAGTGNGGAWRLGGG